MSSEQGGAGSAEVTDEAVYRVLEAVPAGKVTSYAAVADLLGLSTPRRPAAAMRRAPDGLPWWRMIRSDGTIAPALLARARERWDEEGIPHGGAKVPAAAFWVPDDAELRALHERLQPLWDTEPDGKA